MNKLRFTGMLGALVVGGCAHNPMDFRPTMGADSSLVGYEALALVNELQRAYEISTASDKGAAACLTSVSPSYQNVATESFRRLQSNRERHESTVKRLGCVVYKSGKPENFTAHYRAGVALSDLYCDDYFRRIAVHKQKRQFGRSTTNDLGTAASSALGLASAGSILTGGAGVLFGLGDGLWRNYDSAFVVEPDLGTMLNLVRITQKTVRDQYEGTTFGSYFEANSAISEYAQLCSYAGMDRLLNVALQAATDEETIEQRITRFQTSRERIAADRAEARLGLVKRTQAANAETDTLLAKPANPQVEPVAAGSPP